ncbi:hypothetical protein KBA41_14895 [Candidatus Ozemobacteraceae bacterium]|nr:hypothetical protein [Candidatus Ozemobacteraceae bacterium]
MTKSSSSGGTKVGSDLSRISDMFETPSKYIEGHPTYRRRSVKHLVRTAVFFLILLVCAPDAGAAPVSRYDLLEKACQAFWNNTPDEAAVLRSDLLKPFPDGRIHLDWPATRGTALLVLHELLGPATAAATPAATFTDIAPGTPLGSAAAAIGECFESTAKGRFMPDRLLAEGDFAKTLAAIRKTRVIPAEAPEWLVPRDRTKQETANALERHFPVDFTFDDPLKRGSFDETGATDARRLERMHGLVNPDQMAPQEEFDLTTALSGMEELEKTLDTLEITVHELTTEEIPPERVSDTLAAFDEIAALLAGTTDKLRFSRQHLEAAILTDPERLRDAVGLRVRILDSQRRIARLKEKIDTRRPELAGTN